MPYSQLVLFLVSCSLSAPTFLDSLWQIEDGEVLSSDPNWHFNAEDRTPDPDHGRLKIQWLSQEQRDDFHWKYVAQWKPISTWRMEVEYDSLLRNAEMEYLLPKFKVGIGYTHYQMGIFWLARNQWKGQIHYTPQKATQFQIQSRSSYGYVSSSIDYPFHFWTLRGSAQQSLSQRSQFRHQFHLQDSAQQLHWIQSNQWTHKSPQGKQILSVRFHKKSDTLQTLHLLGSLTSRWKILHGKSSLQWTQSNKSFQQRLHNELQIGNSIGIRVALQNRYSTSTKHKAEASLFWEEENFQNALTLHIPLENEAWRIRSQTTLRWSSHWHGNWQADLQKDTSIASWQLRLAGSLSLQW